MVTLTGGLGRYLAASAQLADSVVLPTSIVAVPFETTLRTSRYLLESVLVALGPLAPRVLLVPCTRVATAGAREWLLLAWIAPPRARLHARALRSGRLRADVPAGAGVLLARVLVTPSPRRRAGAPARAGPALRRPRSCWSAGQRRLLRQRAPAGARLRHAEAGVAARGGARGVRLDLSRTAAALHEHEESCAPSSMPSAGCIRGGDGRHHRARYARSYPWLRHAMFYLPGVLDLRAAGRRAAARLLRAAARVGHPAVARQRRAAARAHAAGRVVRGSLGALGGAPADLVEIELPYGRFLYALPIDRRPIAYAGYTLVREPLTAATISLVFLAAALPLALLLLRER